MRNLSGEHNQESPANRYKIHQKLVSISKDFLIEDEHGEKVFKVDGKAVQVGGILILRDSHDNMLCKIQERLLRVKDSMEITDPSGEGLALVEKTLITPIQERWSVKISNGPDLDVQANLLDHEYSITTGRGKPVAQISKKRVHLRDIYDIEILPGQNDMIILATTVAIDNMMQSNR